MYRGVLLHGWLNHGNTESVCERIVVCRRLNRVHGVCGGQVRHYCRRRSTIIDRHMLEL